MFFSILFLQTVSGSLGNLVQFFNLKSIHNLDFPFANSQLLLIQLSSGVFRLKQQQTSLTWCFFILLIPRASKFIQMKKESYFRVHWHEKAFGKAGLYIEITRVYLYPWDSPPPHQPAVCTYTIYIYCVIYTASLPHIVPLCFLQRLLH